MLVLKRIQLINFLSHKNTTIDFKPEHRLLLDGVSGSGKSSIVEALIWGLYNKGRTDNRNLIKRGTTNAEALIQLQDNQTQGIYTIERSVTNKGRHELNISVKEPDKEEIPIKSSGKRNIQEYLEKEILHSSYLLFINSIVYPQDNIENFVKQPATKRKDIILEIVNAAKYDEYQKKTKEELVKYKGVQEVLESRVNDRQNNIQTDTATANKIPVYQAEDERLKSEIKQLEEQYTKVNQEKQKLIEAKIMLNSKELRLTELNKELGNLQLELDSLNNKIIELSTIDLTELKLQVEPLKDKREALKALEEKQIALTQWSSAYSQIIADMPAEHDYEADLQQINNQLIEVLGEEIICPELHKVCPILNERQEKRKKYLQEQLQDKTNEQIKYNNNKQYHNKSLAALGPQPIINIQQLKDTRNEIQLLEVIEKKLIGLQNKDELITKYTADYQALNLKQQQLKADIDSLKLELVAKVTILEQTAKNDKQLLKLEDEIGTLAAQQSSNYELLTIANVAQNRIETSLAEIDKLNKDIIKTKENIESLELLKDAFGTNGIKAIVIDYVVPQLEDKINNILAKLSDFRVRLETQRQGAGEDVILEGLFINIFNSQGEEFDYDNFSGGEKLKIIVAISEALAEIQRISFRILDELFIGLDEESIESFTEVMISLQERFSQLICVSHLRSIKDLFEEKILITKKNDTSSIQT